MAKVITVTNQKGGTGKTTTATTLAAGLNQRGMKTLLIDLDAQCNSSYTLAAERSGASSMGVLMGELSALDAIQHTKSGDIIAASAALAGADAVITQTGKEYRLKEALEPLQKRYNYIVIDTPPALGIITVNALTACNVVLIPAQADGYSLQGIEQLADNIAPIKKYCNPTLSIIGILLTQYNPRAILSREIYEIAGQLAAKIGTSVFETTIRASIVVKEAQISQTTLFDYAPKAAVTDDYSRFIDEFLKRSKKQ